MSSELAARKVNNVCLFRDLLPRRINLFALIDHGSIAEPKSFIATSVMWSLQKVINSKKTLSHLGISIRGNTSNIDSLSIWSTPMETVVPLLITHHSKLFREALRHLFPNTRFRPVHAAPDLDQVSESYLAAGGNCVWLIGVERYTAATNSLACRVGAIAPGVKRVVLAASQATEDPMIAINSGACGFLCEDISPEQLIKSLELIVDGEMVVHGQPFQQAQQLLTSLTQTPPAEPVLQEERVNGATAAIECRTAGANAVAPVSVGSIAVASVIDTSHDLERELSNRERLIMQRLISGNSNKAIARDLVITEATVKVHIKAILRKLRLRNRTQAAIWAREHLFRSGNHKDTDPRF